MTDFTPERIAEIGRRIEAATPGPWEFWAGSVMKGSTLLLVQDRVKHTDECQYCNNALFTVHARTDLPDALNAIEERDARIADLERQLAAAREDTARLDDVIARMQNVGNSGVYLTPPDGRYLWRYVDHDEEGYPGAAGQGETPRAAIDAARAGKEQE